MGENIKKLKQRKFEKSSSQCSAYRRDPNLSLVLEAGKLPKTIYIFLNHDIWAVNLNSRTFAVLRFKRGIFGISACLNMIKGCSRQDLIISILVELR